MRGKAKGSSATDRAATVVWMVAGMVAPVWLVPALVINVDWAAGLLSPWNLAAAGSILASALFIEAARHSRSWVMGSMFVVASLFLAGVNVQVAFEHAASKSDRRSDDRRSAMKTAQDQSSQRSQWSQGRSEAATIAGETPAGKYEADIQQLISRNSDRWQATGECGPMRITAEQSKAFCASVAELRGRADAARRRDALDTKINAAVDRAGGVEVPTTADPYADNVAAFLGIFGMKFDDDGKRALSASKDLLRSAGLEIIAAFAPTGWLLMVGAFMSGSSRPRPTEAKAERPPRAAPVATPRPVERETPVDMDDPFHAFIAEKMEDATGTRLPAGEPWQCWLVYCADKRLDAGSQKVFGVKMKARFAWESNNNRPRYLNVKIKSEPAIRLAVSNPPVLGSMARKTG